MSDRQPPGDGTGYRSPFLSPSAPPPGGSYPPQPPYVEVPPSPASPSPVRPPPVSPPPVSPPPVSPPPEPAPAPLFDPEALFRPPAPPPRPPEYPLGGSPSSPRFTPGTIVVAVVAVLALIGAGVWAVGQQGKGVKQAESASGGVKAAPDRIAVADLPPAPPVPAGYVPRHIAGMTFAVPANCQGLVGSDLGYFADGLRPNTHLLDACVRDDGNAVVMVVSVDFNLPPDTVLQDPSARDKLQYEFLANSLQVPAVATHDVLGRPGLVLDVSYRCTCTHSVYYTVGMGSGADNDLYMILVGQMDAPPDAAAVIDSARPTR